MKKSQACIYLAITTSILSAVFLYAPQAISKTTTRSAGISVNGTAIPQARINAEVNEQIEQGAPPEERALIEKRVKMRLIDLEFMSQEAKRRGLEKDADVIQRLTVARQVVLAQALDVDYKKKNPISDADLTREYEAYKAELGDKEYKPRHILVATEDEAKAIINELNKGGDFKKIARLKSHDVVSKDNGGELDWGGGNRVELVCGSVFDYGPAFIKALKSLPKGQITQKPVWADHGYHVIKMDDVRDAKPKSFEESKTDLRNKIQQRRLNEFSENLRSKTKIVGAE